MFISPMLLHKSDEPFDNDSYITELKLDGIRLILTKFNNQVKLYTRHNNEVTSKFPELLTLNLPDGIALDGELVVSDDNGKPDFEDMMQRFQSSKSKHLIKYCAFDIIYFDSQKVKLPLVERKQLLESIIPNDHPYVATVKWLYGNGAAYFNLVKEQDLEGIVLKKANSKYQIDKRSKDWLKVINYQYDDILITGMRKDEFGLLLAFDDPNNHAGVMEFMPPKDRMNFYSMRKIINENDKYAYIEPIKCRVKYRNLTKKGKLRIPSFVEWVS